MAEPEKVEPLKPYYPDQCCGDGYCIDELGVHGATREHVESMSKYLANRDRLIRAETWDECSEQTHMCECALGPHIQHPANPYRTQESP